MTRDTWKTIEAFLAKQSGIPKEVINYLAVSKILLGCVTGLSNQEIAEEVNLDIEVIESVLKEFLKFKGWTAPLQFNPYYIYKTQGERGLKKAVGESELHISICRKYQRIEEAINEHY